MDEPIECGILREFRRKHNLRQEDLAKRIGVSRTAYVPVEAIQIFASTIKQVSRVNSKLDFLGIIVNSIDERTSVHKHYRDSIRAMFGEKVLGMIHRAALITEIQPKRQTVMDVDKALRQYLEFRDLAKLLDKIIFEGDSPCGATRIFGF